MKISTILDSYRKLKCSWLQMVSFLSIVNEMGPCMNSFYPKQRLGDEFINFFMSLFSS